MSNTVSGKLCVKILCKYFGFLLISQKGSHVKLRRKLGSRTITTIVPLHRELATGTLRGILEFAEVPEELFFDYI